MDEDREPDDDGDGGGASTDTTPALDDAYEVLYDPDDVHEDAAMSDEGEGVQAAMRGVEGERFSLWETVQDLLLTLLDVGARTSKGALHALAPHALLLFARFTPELMQGMRARR